MGNEGKWVVILRYSDNTYARFKLYPDRVQDPNPGQN